MAFLIAGFLVHAYGMVLRMMISGRPPVTNMYESVIWVAWGAMLFALIFEFVYKARYIAACAAAVAVISLILADNVPILDGSIDPLVPVLRDNMWLTIHVLTITLGVRGLLPGHGHRPLEPRPLLLRSPEGRAPQDLVAVPLPVFAGGDAVPGRGHDARRGVGVVLVGTLLGLGPEGNLGRSSPSSATSPSSTDG